MTLKPAAQTVERTAEITEDSHHSLDTSQPVVGVGAMIVRDNHVMLARRRGSHGAGTYAWCGGGLEFGESLEEAVIREVSQESGLVVTSARLLCVSNIREYGRHYIDFEFLCEADGDPVHTEPEKSGPWAWYDLDALPQPLFKPVEFALESYRAGNWAGSFFNEE